MKQDKSMTKPCRWLYAFLILLIIVTACTPSRPLETDLIINDFETDADLDRLRWKCHTLFFLSDQGVSHGQSSLRMELTPSPYPGVSFKDFPQDWRGYSFLDVSFFNPGPSELRLAVRIDDKEDAPAYEDRFNHGLTVHPGMNRLSIPFSSLVCPSGRRLEPAHIYSLMFFAVNPDKTVVLFVDDLRLKP